MILELKIKTKTKNLKRLGECALLTLSISYGKEKSHFIELEN